MLSALGNVFSVILVIALGFFFAKRGWFDAGSGALISRLVVSIALPAYMLSNLLGSYDKAKLLSMLPGLPLPFAVMIAGYALAVAFAALFRIRTERRGTFACMFALSNTIFIGLPVNLAVFGEKSLSYVLLYYIANTSLFWTVGVYGIARDGARRAGRAAPTPISATGIKRIFSPPLLAFILAVLLIFSGVGLPSPILASCKLLGSMTTPLSMLFIGIAISRVEWKKLRAERDILLVLAGRFFISPLILLCLARYSTLPLLMKQVFLVQAAMPAMTQTPILAEANEADVEYAGLATALTTVSSLAVIPLLMLLVGTVF